MAIDPNVVFKIEQPNFIESQRRAESENLNIQAQQIANSRSLTQLEMARVQEAKIKRQEEYDKWRGNNSPEINPATGTYDITDYIQRAIKSGHGEFALRDADELHKNQIDNAKNKQELMAGHETAMQTFAATASQFPADQRQAEADRLATEYKQQHGIDPRDVYGPNWYDVILKRSQTTAENRIYNTAEGRNPRSNISSSLRKIINDNGGSIPDNISAFEIVTNPLYREQYDRISPEVRTSAIERSQTARATIDKITGMLGVIDQAFKDGIKPTETVRKWIESALNDDERAKRRQIISELKGMGIEIAETDSIQGARDALVRQQSIAEGTYTGAAGIASSKTISGAVAQQPTPAPKAAEPKKPVDQPVPNGVQYRLPNGEIRMLTPEQVKKYGNKPGFSPVNQPQTTINRARPALAGNPQGE
jgi:hypothetical protein